MDQAGYNPIEAIEFWKRMKQRREGKQPLVYLSTHPADDKRIAEIEKILQDQKKEIINVNELKMGGYKILA